MKKLLMIMLVLLLSINITGCGRSLDFSREDFTGAGMVTMKSEDTSDEKSWFRTTEITYDENDNLTAYTEICQYTDYDEYMSDFANSYKFTMSGEDWVYNNEEYRHLVTSDDYENHDWEAGLYYTEVTKDDDTLTVTKSGNLETGLAALYTDRDNAYLNFKDYISYPNQFTSITYEKFSD